MTGPQDWESTLQRWFEPFVSERGAKRGRSPADHRRVLDAVFWISRAGSPWRWGRPTPSSCLMGDALRALGRAAGKPGRAESGVVPDKVQQAWAPAMSYSSQRNRNASTNAIVAEPAIV